MEIKTTRQIYDAEDFNSSLCGEEAHKAYQVFMNERWVRVGSLTKEQKEYLGIKNE